MENFDAYQLLIEKYVNNACSKAELDELFAMAGKDSEGLLKALKDEWRKTELDAMENQERREMLFNSMMAGFTARPEIGRRRVMYRAAAAAAIVVIGGTIWLLSSNHHREQPVAPQQVAVQKIEPGGQKAVLTLGDGTHIDLGAAANGAIAQQGGSKVTKADGKIDYSRGGQGPAVVYNTISTPRGGEYQLQLADGTRVWLNAASSLRYPTAFTGKDRIVELTGEAYFEVRANAAMPFHVKVKQTDIEDLGTEFDVNAYDDEAELRTTLVKGGVRVTGPAHSLVLKPGEQAVVNGHGLERNTDVDIDEVTAWKNGNFIFNSTSLDEIMKQIARWYDLQVQFEGPYQSRTFSGIVSRNSPLPEVLNIMKQAGIKFQVEGGIISVGQ